MVVAGTFFKVPATTISEYPKLFPREFGDLVQITQKRHFFTCSWWVGWEKVAGERDEGVV